VWAVGTIGTILHYNGTTWSSVSSGTTQSLRGVWGTSASDVWAVGGSGTILHYNGTSWLSVTSGTRTQTLFGTWGTSSSNVWAVGVNGRSSTARQAGDGDVIVSVFSQRVGEMLARSYVFGSSLLRGI
jgi:hypothetical protein